MSRQSLKDKHRPNSTACAVRIEASPTLRFDITPSRFGTNVVLQEVRSPLLTIHQSMNFETESQFIDWHSNEDGRHRFPSAYARLKAHVLSLIRMGKGY